MLTNKEVSDMCKMLNAKGFSEITEPQLGYNGYLLRCNAPAEEKGEDTILLKAPGGIWGHTRLDNDVMKRVEMRKKWFGKTTHNLYVAVNIEVHPKLRKHIENLFLNELSDADIMRISQYYCKILTNNKLPSFEPFIVVWHLNQCQEYPDGSLDTRPMHAHFLFARKTKRITSEEARLIRPG